MKDVPSNFRSQVWAHFGFYYTDNGTTLDNVFAIRKNCLAKVKYMVNTMNMHSHLVHHYPDLAVEDGGNDANASVSQPTIYTVFKAKLPFALHFFTLLSFM